MTPETAANQLLVIRQPLPHYIATSPRPLHPPAAGSRTANGWGFSVDLPAN